MRKNYMELYEKSEFMQAWNGKKGYVYKGVRVQTSNRYLEKDDLMTAINTPLVKQLYQYDNHYFQKVVSGKGFHIKHRLADILFYKEKGQYWLSSINVKTEDMFLYEVSEKTILKDKDRAITIPLENLIKIISSPVFHT